MEAKTHSHHPESARHPRSAEPAVEAAKVARDIIVIGASTGGVDALSRLVKLLPADLPAAVFIVLHTHTSAGRPPEILRNQTGLKAAYALHGEPIEHARIYIAPPDNHLMIEPNYVHVVRGPRENGHRPAVDPLFRTAARSYGARVAGVLLTGALDCGTAGLMMIKAQGGVAIVQDPDEAVQPDMPRNALRQVEVDHVLELARIGPLLVRLARNGANVPATTPDSLLEDAGAKTTQLADVACPSCGGVMTESTVLGLTRYRCHTGHAFSMDGLVTEQARALEATLWAAVRALDESEMLARRLAARADADLERRLEEKAESMKQRAERIRQMLLGEDELTTAAATTNGNWPQDK